MKINIKNLKTGKSGMANLQILVLVVSVFAFAFLIAGVSENGAGKKDISKQEGLARVSAQTDLGSILSGKSCCLETKEGAQCQDLSSSDCSAQCSESCMSTDCSNAAECKLGCCFDKDEGLCSPSSGKNDCENNTNGQWFEDSTCNNVNECQKGCCILGLQSQFVTEQTCKKQASLYGIPFKFEGGDEVECIKKADSIKSGACVYGETVIEGKDEKRMCKFTTSADCSTADGEFHENYLCSNAELNTVCEKQKTTNCVEGEDGVYWFDSCGNRENIYSSDKTGSWNNGKVKSKEESCGTGSANIESSSCGNCDYEKGSICGKYRAGIDGSKPTFGDYTCRDLNCKQAPGHAGVKKDRINGESWCVYDGQIGNAGASAVFGALGLNFDLPVGFLSADVVGSRHFRYVCVNGEVQVEGCADARKEVCVESEKKSSEGESSSGKTTAICRVNMYENCLGLNGDKGCETDCMARCVINPDCRIQDVNVDKDFKFRACVPKYPPGFDLGSTSGLGGMAMGAIGGAVGEGLGGMGSNLLSQLGSAGGGTDAGSICGIASQTCTVTYVKKCPGGWKCVSNCKCMEQAFTLQMNNLCVSAGDCGAYTNIAGVVTDGGYKVSKKGSKGKVPPKLTLISQLYAIFAVPTPGASAAPGFFDSVPALDTIGKFGIEDMFGDGYARIQGDVGSGLFGNQQIGSTIGMTAVTGLGAGVAAGAIGASMLAGATGGAAANVLTFAGMGSFSAVGAAFAWAAVAMVAVIALMMAMGCGKTEVVEIKFECKPWTRPMGSGGLLGILSPQKIGCESCGKDPMKPCTRYRCESLGTRCRLINENTGQDLCITDKSEVGAPMISPWPDALNQSMFKYTDVSQNGFRIRTINDECLPAFTPFSFGVLTDVYAQCKISNAPFNTQTSEEEAGGISTDGSESDETGNVIKLITGKIIDINNKIIKITGKAVDESASSTDGSEETASEIDDSECDEENCGYDIEPVEGSFLEGNLFTKNHSYIEILPSAESMVASETNDGESVSEQTYQEIVTRTGDINYYVKCANIDGQENEQEFKINICVKPGPDWTPPAVIATSPPTNSFTSFIATEQNTTLWLTEPSECKWGIENTMNFSDMTNTMTCEADAAQISSIGYPCNTMLSLDILKNESKFYFSCKDQPWLASTNESARNTGNLFEYTLKRSKSALSITKISPSGSMMTGVEPVTINLEVETSGGVIGDGTAGCVYKLEDNQATGMFETWASYHKQPNLQLTSGEHKIKVSCIDSIGNYAENETLLNIEIDNTIPEVTRVYYDSNLVIATTENAECYYDYASTDCNFPSSSEGVNVEFMNGGGTMLQSTDWAADKTYYIQCKDTWGNKPSGCSIVVKPKNSVQSA